MSSISSWMLRIRPDVLAASFLVGVVATAACAREVGVRIRPDSRNMDYVTFLKQTDVSGALAQIGTDMPTLIPGISDCATLSATPLEETPTIDVFTDTRVRMEIFRVECWAFQLVPADAKLVPATPGDGITRAMTDALMHYLLEKSATDPLENGAVDNEWLKTFTAFPGGDLNCKTPWSCTLTLPDGKVYPEQYLYIDLILAFGNRRYLEVTEAVYGSPRFVYGVELDLNDGAPRVVSLNFVPS